MGCASCTELLNEALNLVVRARAMDAMDRRETTLSVSSDPEAWLASGRFDDHVARHNIEFPYKPIETRSLTLHVWVLDQYERDLHSWEEKARKHLMTVDHTALQERGRDE